MRKIDLVNYSINLKESTWQKCIKVVQTELCKSWLTHSKSRQFTITDLDQNQVPLSLATGLSVLLLLSFLKISFTLKSLMCRNSSMIDLDFLSISSSDKAGLSGADVAGISGFVTSEVKKSEKVKTTEIIIKMGGLWLTIFMCCYIVFLVKALK